MKKYIVLILLFNLIRIIILPFFGMMPQDAYYYFYSEHLSLSYFDHPPMVAYMQYVFSLVFGKTVFSVKLADFVVSLGTQLLFFYLAKKVLSPQQSTKALLLLTSTILISSISLITTPDVPLLFFWTLAILFLYKAIFEIKKWNWIWAGIAMGLAFDSKYTAVGLPAGLFLFLLVSGKYRHYLRQVWPYLAVLLMAIVSLPVLLWNLDHDFASFSFQSNQRTDAISKINVSNVVGLVGMQLFLLLPIIFVGLWWLIVRYSKRFAFKTNRISAESLFLFSFFLPMFLGFYFLSFFIWVKLNWLMPAYISGLILLTPFISNKLIKWQLGISIFFHLLIMVEVFFYPVAVKSDDTWYGWENFAEQTEQIRDKYPDAFVFSRDGYKTASQLQFFTNKKVYSSNIVGERALHYDYIGDNVNDLIGKDALFIDSDKRLKTDEKSDGIYPKVSKYFGSVVELEPILVKKGEKTVRKFYIYYCTDYKGLPAKE
ncbi:MAG TPA: hypothetical protein DCG69_04750 [Bacteroidales bacterium]|nr:hypothetical protein [Bacteroidales bacterium]